MDDNFNGFESELRPEEKILWEGEAKKSVAGGIIAAVIAVIIGTLFLKVFMIFSVIIYLIAGIMIAATVRSLVKGVEYRDRFALTDKRAIVYYTTMRSFASANYRDIKSIKEKRRGKYYSLKLETEENLLTMDNIICDDVEVEIIRGYLRDAESRKRAYDSVPESVSDNVSADDFFSQSLPENYMERFRENTAAVHEGFTADVAPVKTVPAIPEEMWDSRVRSALKYVKSSSFSKADREVYAMGTYKEKFGGLYVGIILISTALVFGFLMINGIGINYVTIGMVLFTALAMTAFCLSMTGKHTYVVTNAHVVWYKGFWSKSNRWLAINSETYVDADTDSLTIYSGELRAIRKNRYKKHGEVSILVIDGVDGVQAEEIVSAVNFAVEKLR